MGRVKKLEVLHLVKCFTRAARSNCKLDAPAAAATAASATRAVTMKFGIMRLFQAKNKTSWLRKLG